MASKELKNPAQYPIPAGANRSRYSRGRGVGVACLLLSFCAACGDADSVDAADDGGPSTGPTDDDVTDDDAADDDATDDDAADDDVADDDATDDDAADDDAADDDAADDDAADDDAADDDAADDDAADDDATDDDVTDDDVTDDDVADDDAGNAMDDADAGMAIPDAGGPEIPSGTVDLGTAGDFVILAKSGISTVPSSAITGNIGVSPAAATFITGFSLIADPTNAFATSPQIVGRAYAADYEPPTPSYLTTAIGDMELAFTDAAGRAPNFTELGAGNIGGMTLVAGVYKWGTGLAIPTDVTLSGNGTDVWILQIAQDLTLSSATNVFLSGGARSENVFWQVAGLVELGTTAHCEGVILTQTSATLGTGSSLNGRLLAQTAVTLDASTVTEPQ